MRRAGQAFIAIPILGAVLGSVAGKVLSNLLSRQIKDAGDAVRQRVLLDREFRTRLE